MRTQGTDIKQNVSRGEWLEWEVEWIYAGWGTVQTTRGYKPEVIRTLWSSLHTSNPVKETGI